MELEMDYGTKGILSRVKLGAQITLIVEAVHERAIPAVDG